MAIFRGGGVRLFVCCVLVPSSAAFRALPARRGGAPAMTLGLSSWSELESRLPSCACTEMPTFDADTVDPAALEGATVLYADRNRWCPNSERVWLALELKRARTRTLTRTRTLILSLALTRVPTLVQTLTRRARYVTVLVDDDYSATPGEEGSLPRVQWPDGTTHDGSAIGAILERIEEEHPHAPNFFPRISVTVAVVRDSLRRFDAIMPRFTRPSSLAPYVYACKIQVHPSPNPHPSPHPHPHPHSHPHSHPHPNPNPDPNPDPNP